MAIYRIDGIEHPKAQKIGEILESLGKDFTPQDVIETAADPNSPLNSFFQWDDSKAASEYRLTQARTLIQRIKIIVEVNNEKIQTRAFHHVELVRQNKLVPRYVSLRTIKTNKNLADQVIAQALRELRDWNRKYKEYSHILGEDLFEVIDETLKELRGSMSNHIVNRPVKKDVVEKIKAMRA